VAGLRVRLLQQHQLRVVGDGLRVRRQQVAGWNDWELRPGDHVVGLRRSYRYSGC